MIKFLTSMSLGFLFIIGSIGYLYADEDDLVSKGERLFQEKGCVACHTIGKGKLAGPDLAGVTERRKEDWLKRWIMHPDTMLYTDPIAKELLKEFMVPMPNQGVSEDEVNALIYYFKHRDEEMGEEEEDSKLPAEGSYNEEDEHKNDN